MSAYGSTTQPLGTAQLRILHELHGGEKLTADELFERTVEERNPGTRARVNRTLISLSNRRFIEGELREDTQEWAYWITKEGNAALQKPVVVEEESQVRQKKGHMDQLFTPAGVEVLRDLVHLSTEENNWVLGSEAAKSVHASTTHRSIMLSKLVNAGLVASKPEAKPRRHLPPRTMYLPTIQGRVIAGISDTEQNALRCFLSLASESPEVAHSELVDCLVDSAALIQSLIEKGILVSFVNQSTDASGQDAPGTFYKLADDYSQLATSLAKTKSE